jgi:hypothetical protein
MEAPKMNRVNEPGQIKMNRVNEPGHRPRFSPPQAAKVTGVSLSTIKRKRVAGEFPNAAQDERGGWLIPVEDLLAAGLHVNAPSRSVNRVNEPGQKQMNRVNEPGHEPGQNERIAQLEWQLQEANTARLMEQIKREAAEQIAHEREKRAQSAERALLMLEAHNPAPTVPVETPQPVAQPVQEKPRLWWRRGRN